MRLTLPWSRHRTRPTDWRRLTAVFLALLGLLAGSLAWMSYSQAVRTEPLVIAAQPIPPGTRLTPEMLSVIQAPLVRPAALLGMNDPTALIGGYARVAIGPDQIVRADMVQTQPLDAHVYVNDPLPPEQLQGTAFELPLTGINSVTAQDALNILVQVDMTQGEDPSFRVSAEDAPGSGARTVRVLRHLNVLHVAEQTVFLEVTPAQSQYLWSLSAANIPFVGELGTARDVPLGSLRPGDADSVLLQGNEDSGFSSDGAVPSTPPQEVRP
jgi:hypothetical protein